MGNVTMRDLGRRLGVSAVTVSKALAGKAGVSGELRQKIIRLAEEMGYVNPNARTDQAKKRLDVGILIPSHFFSNDSFYAMLYKELVQTLTEAGHFGLLELVTPEMQQSRTLPNLLRSRKVDAVILLGQPSREYAGLLVSQMLPVICMDFHDAGIQADSVVSDGAGGMEALTQHLIERGHRDIAFYGTVRATSSIMDRYLGYVAAMVRCDLPVREEYLLPDRDDQGRLLPLMLPENRPTALVCNCDLAARWAIDQLRQQNLRVPEDISVVGFDDCACTPAILPGLTTCRFSRQEMCRNVVQLLADRCAGRRKSVCRLVIGSECVYRDSVNTINDQYEKR